MTKIRKSYRRNWLATLVLSALCSALCLGAFSAPARADGWVAALDGTLSVPSDGTPVNLITFQSNTNTEKKIYTAKAIVENQSGGVRVIQCRLEQAGFVDYANVTLAPGANTTVPLIVYKPASGYSGSNGSFNCRVISSLKDGVIAGWAKIHVELANF